MSIDEYKKRYNVDTVHTISKEQRDRISSTLKDKYKNDTDYVEMMNERRSSIWTTEYWIAKGYTEQDAINKVSELQSNNSRKRDYTESASTLSIQHWINKGYSEMQAKSKISAIQSKLSEHSSKFEGKRHSLEARRKISSAMSNYIYKVGKSKWVSHFDNYDGLEFRSTDEIEIYEYIRRNISDDATANEFIGDYNVDILLNDKIIEYFGDYWHCHESLFEDADIHPHIQKKALDVRKYDETKINYLLDNGYRVMVFWEHDYRQNKEMVFSKIKEFLVHGS